MGNMQSAQLLFNTYPNPDSFMWGVLIKNYVWNSSFKEAVSLYHQMVYAQPYICKKFIYPSLLKACSGLSDVNTGCKFHGRVIKSGLEFDRVVETSLLCMYSEFRSLDAVKKVFDGMSVRDVVAWSSMVSSYVRNGRVYDGLGLFRKMVFQGVEVDSVILLSVSEACYLLCDRKLAKSVHGFIVRRMIESNESLESSLIVMYGKCNDLDNAERIFNRASSRNIATWTAMISCYNHWGHFREALHIYVDMQESNVTPNSVTMVGVLLSCSRLAWLRVGMSVHGFVVRSGIDLDLGSVGPALIDMYGNCVKLQYCERVFNCIQEQKIVSWNSLIAVYAQNGLSEDALRLFVQMRIQGMFPDSFTLASSLQACGKISNYELGSQIHGLVAKTGVGSNEFVQNSLIDMYCKSYSVDTAYKVFNEVQEKSLITWNSMIWGFTQSGDAAEALNLLDQMHYQNLEMDKVTFLSAVQACSHLGYLEKGRQFHHKLVISGLEKDFYVNTALTDMYAKCGDLPMAQRVFDTMLEKSVVSWSAMIAGYGNHGCLDNAISLFSQMVGLGIKPNEVTFMSILSACSHAGSVEKGMYYFNLMREEYCIEPELEHLIYMVDLLSRAGDLIGALEFIKFISVPASSSIWGALLNGCRIHGRLDMIGSIQRVLLDLEADNSGYCTLLSNIYAEGGKWDEFGKLRSMMKNVGLRKVPGYSAIQINGRISKFVTGDTSNLQTNEVNNILESPEILAQDSHCLDKGSEVQTVHAKHNAISFGSINTSPGTTLDISKNLRVSVDLVLVLVEILGDIFGYNQHSNCLLLFGSLDLSTCNFHVICPHCSCWEPLEIRALILEENSKARSRWSLAVSKIHVFAFSRWSHQMAMQFIRRNSMFKSYINLQGPSGLMAARELRKEGHTVVVLEQNHEVGGQWLYDPNVEGEDPLGKDGVLMVHSSIYASLRLTSPREIMGCTDFPFLARKGRDTRRFPSHEEHLLYLKDLCEWFRLRDMIRFNTRVEYVGMLNFAKFGSDKWLVRSKDIRGQKVFEEVYDAVVVATGHYSQPRLPNIKGMDTWRRKQMHSHAYRVPQPFVDEVVVVVGNSMSGTDISMELVHVAKEIHLSAKSLEILEGLTKVIAKYQNLHLHPQIDSLHEDGRVLFVDGTSVNADSIVYCTGYEYSFPFLDTKGMVVVDDGRVGPLYEHTFPPSLAPSLSFVGIPRKVLALPFFEAQAKWIAQVLAGKRALPSWDDMMRSVQEFYKSREIAGIPKKYTHEIARDFEAECFKYGERCGFPRLEEWRTKLLVATVIRAACNLETYRDSYDEDHELLQEAHQSHHFTQLANEDFDV
ncbi:hypothetical protein IFM89_007113 [Coptis chinensis]|uniref:Flavin-containing monooxygenase n=1 Tax=Coptis chinensis TaxID=261450 RepID=A0A835H557_9MAGN|nr:hypothetical protein IFM89_007113 [Coptis chinensis]